MRILLVDDDPISLTFLSFHLAALGHEVTTAENGEKAWEFLHSNPCQIVISDWSMPGLSGTDLCRLVRAGKSKDYSYFILITSFKGSGKMAEAMEAGVDDFLAKPVDLDSLVARLRVAARILDFNQQIGMLHDILPICMYCKKIRDDRQYWVGVETYFNTHTGTDFSHSLCPDCYTEKVKPQLDELKKDSMGS